MTNKKSLWTEEKIITNAFKYKSRKSWRVFSSKAYSAACRKGLLGQCIHSVGSIERVLWMESTCLAKALEYQTKESWRTGSSGSFKYAQRNGLVERACRHMKTVIVQTIIFNLLGCLMII